MNTFTLSSFLIVHFRWIPLRQSVAALQDVVVMDPEAAAARLQQEPQAPAQVKAMIEERKEFLGRVQYCYPLVIQPWVKITGL